MSAAFGPERWAIESSKVLKLVRIGIGGLRIGDLPIGRYRELTPAEVALLAKGK